MIGLFGHKIVMAGNILWSGMAAPVFLIFGAILWRRVREGKCGPTERLMAGVCFVAFGGAIHRFYWAMWRYFLDTDQGNVAAYFVDYGWMLTLVVIAVAIGYTLHLKPYLEEVLGKWWLPSTVAYGVGLCAIPFLI